MIFFDWIYDDLSQTQKDQALAAFKVWGDYHLARMDYNPNPGAGENVVPMNWVRDSDHISAVTELYLLLGLMLVNESGYEETAAHYLQAADHFRNIVESYYFEDFMAGGVWAEGTFCSPNTMRHWLKVNIINKETRAIPDLNNSNDYDPSAYLEKNLISLLHRTFPSYSSMYIYNGNDCGTEDSRPSESETQACTSQTNDSNDDADSQDSNASSEINEAGTGESSNGSGGSSGCFIATLVMQ